MAPEFIVIPSGAAYSSGKKADLYFRDNPFITQIGVLEADERDNTKFQFKVMTVNHGHSVDYVGKGGYSANLASRELAVVADGMWQDALFQRFGRATEEARPSKGNRQDR